MTLKAVLFDRKKLIAHGSYKEPLQELLLSLYAYGVQVIDIALMCAEDEKESNGQTKRTAKDISIAHILTKRRLSFSDCLLLADCEETVRQAKRWNMAVLGYQPVLEEKQREGGIKRRTWAITSHLDMLVEGFEEVDFYFLERVYQRFHHLPWTVIETERCILREITVQDLDALYQLYEPPQITRYLDALMEERQKEEAYTRAYIETMYRFYGYGLWVVVEKETGELIGRAGIEHLEIEAEVCLQLGYVIAQHKQRQGIATEICRGILEYADKVLEADKIYCLIQKENVNSIRLAEKLGFYFEKTIKNNGKPMQRYVKILQT